MTNIYGLQKKKKRITKAIQAAEKRDASTMRLRHLEQARRRITAEIEKRRPAVKTINVISGKNKPR